MRKQILIGIVLLMLASTSVLPASANQIDPKNVELSIWGGIGVNAAVHNKANSTVQAELEIKSQYFTTVTHFSVSPKTRTPVTLFQLAFYRPINVTLTVGNQQLMKTGFVIGIFVFLA